MQSALTTAVTAAGSLLADVPFCIAALDPAAGPFPMAMTPNAQGTYYVASMAKAAALYTLFELRNVVRNVAKELQKKCGAIPPDLLSQADKDLQPKYAAFANGSPLLPNIRHDQATPKLSTVFDPSGGASLDFTSSTAAAIAGMIFNSDNNLSAQCIRGCGYGTINGTLANGGFFDGANGIWLAGDYADTITDAQKAAKYRAFKIPVVGNVKEPVAAQASSAFQMARLFALMVRGDLFGGDSASCAKMREYLSGGPGSPGPNETFMQDAPSSYTVVSAKLGVFRFPIGGPWSETSILKQSGKQFVVSWANLSTTRSDVTHIIDVVNAALAAYLSSGSGP